VKVHGLKKLQQWTEDLDHHLRTQQNFWAGMACTQASTFKQRYVEGRCRG